MIGDNSTDSDGIANVTTQGIFLDSGRLLVEAVGFYISYAVIGIGIIGTRGVHGNGIPRGNGIPMGFPWEWE